MTDFTPALLAAQARERGTPVLELEPCDKCREPTAIYFYEREGRTHNGCLWCRHVEGKAPLALTANQELLTSAAMVDDEGNPIYEGRACKECGGKIRLVGTAYGSKNKGACLACAIHQHNEKEHGKQLKRVNRAVTEKVHKFIVQSIERSGVVEVAPRTQQEFFELRELAYRCEVMNQQERALQTGIRWELGHKFPAMVAGELRGKATVENIYLVQYGLNRREGNGLPEQWEQRQVISIEGCRAIQRSYEAAKAWKERREWEHKLTPAEKKERTAAERKANDEHCALVASICQNAARVIDFFDADYIPTFEHLRRRVGAQWDRVVLKMDRLIGSFIQSGRDEPYAVVRDKRLTMEAFCGAQSRLWIVVQTFDQLADAEAILMEQGLTDEQQAQLCTVKRYAVQWAQNILDNPQVLVMGFTHPLLSVLGNWQVWGTEEGADGKQWVCAWRQGAGLIDRLTPFDGEAPDLDFCNKVLIPNQELLTSELSRSPDFSSAGGWSSTGQDFAYEQAKQKAAREARERYEADKKAQQEAHQRALQEQTSKRLTGLIETLRDGLEGLYDYAGEMLPGFMQDDAHRLILEQYAKASQQEAELIALGKKDYATVEQFERELNHWQASNDYIMRSMRKGSVVFADLLNPF